MDVVIDAEVAVLKVLPSDIQSVAMRISISAGLLGISKALSFESGENNVSIVFISVRGSLTVVLPSVASYHGHVNPGTAAS